MCSANSLSDKERDVFMSLRDLGILTLTRKRANAVNRKYSIKQLQFTYISFLSSAKHNKNLCHVTTDENEKRKRRDNRRKDELLSFSFERFFVC